MPDRFSLKQVGSPACRLSEEEQAGLFKAVRKGLEARARLQRPGLLPLKKAELQTLVQAGREAEARLVRMHLGLVRKVAFRYIHLGESFEDLMQAGLVGLLLAIRRFNPDHGAAFPSFAYRCIQSAILKFVQDGALVRLPRYLHFRRIQIQKVREQWGEAWETLSPEDKAALLGLSSEQVQNAESSLYPIYSLDDAYDGEHELWIERVSGGESPEETLLRCSEDEQRQKLIQAVRESLKELPERERVVAEGLHRPTSGKALYSSTPADGPSPAG